jgi:glutathione peroxidase
MVRYHKLDTLQYLLHLIYSSFKLNIMIKNIIAIVSATILVFSVMSFIPHHNKMNKAENSIYDIQINSLEGNPIHLNEFKGKKILFVNVASKCGFTPQYEDLQKLHEKYPSLVIIGVPCNQFGGQEPGNSSEISSFCKKNYGVTFLLTEKVEVKGSNTHPLYKWLTQKDLNGVQDSDVKWNFQKYIIDENGHWTNYFPSKTKPLSSEITSVIEK